jgi:hypothetical protein
MKWKGCGRKRSCPILIHYPNIIMEALTKSNAQHSQDNWCQARDLKLGLPEYEAGMLATRPQRSTIHVLRI